MEYEIYKLHEEELKWSEFPIYSCDTVEEVTSYINYYSMLYPLTRYRIDSVNSITFINRLSDLEYFTNHEELIRKRKR